MEVLTKSKCPLNRGQIAEATGLDPVLVSHTLKVMLRWNDIQCIEVDRNEAAKLLNSKSPLRRMRFYYIGKLSKIRKR